MERWSLCTEGLLGLREVADVLDPITTDPVTERALLRDVNSNEPFAPDQRRIHLVGLYLSPFLRRYLDRMASTVLNRAEFARLYGEIERLIYVRDAIRVSVLLHFENKIHTLRLHWRPR